LGKVQVLQIFGSWCPNCIDETQFINNWRKNNSDLDIKFALLAFERSPNKEHALKQLRKAKANYSIDYPILVAGYTKEDKVENVLPGLEDFISFPTTIYIDKKGKIRKILASFQGPATGKYFDEFSRSFDLFLKKLSQE
jgi:thiol-disulfide isomerase/thioredoxin